MEWKALANGIIHEGLDFSSKNPDIRVTIIGCEKCGNPYLELILSNQFPMFISDYTRVTLSIYRCPECGHQEMDCIGTYGLPDYMPETVTPFVGHFFNLWFGLLKLSHEKKYEDYSNKKKVRPYLKKFIKNYKV